MDLFWKLINEITEYIPSRINPVSNRGYFNKIESYKNNPIKQLEQYETKFKNTNNPKQLAKVGTEYNSLKELKKIAADETKKLDSKDQETLKDLFKDDPDFFNN